MKKKAVKYLDKHFVGSIEDKTIIITGGNSGIGLEVARECAYKKMNIILSVRSLERGEKAKEDILNDFPNAKISVMKLDVSEEESIRGFVNDIISNNID